MLTDDQRDLHQSEGASATSAGSSAGAMALAGSESQTGIYGLFERLSLWYDAAAVRLSIVTLVLLVVLVAIQVFYRYVLDHPLTWTEELATYVFAWMIFLGATVSIRHETAPALRTVVDRLSASSADVIENLANLVGLGLGAIVLWQSVGMIGSTLMHQLTPALQIPVAIPFVVMPIAGIGFVLHYLARISWRLKGSGSSARHLVISSVLAVLVFAAPQVIPVDWANLALVAALVLGFAIGLPVAFVLVFAVLYTLMTQGDQPLSIIPSTLFTGANNVLLMAVPFFMLTGATMQTGGLANRLVDFSSALVGRFRGGLLFVDVISSAIFADISGSAVSDTAAIGSVLLPEMTKRGYDKKFSTALQAASGTLGVLFPPSISTIVYSWVANVSVAEMFTASFVPAIIMVLSYCTVAFIAARRNNYPREHAASAREVAGAFQRNIWALIAPGIILGGILTGAVTPTESGVVAVLYTFLVSAVIYRSLSVHSLWESLYQGVIGASRVMFVLSAALTLSWLMTVLYIPQTLSQSLSSLSSHPLVLLILLNLLLVVIHGVLETNATIIVIVPLILPIFEAVGVSPIQLGIVFLVNSALGLLTPPLGLLLYVAAPITGLKIETLARALVPFMFTVVVDLALVILFPQISTALPALLMHH